MQRTRLFFITDIFIASATIGLQFVAGGITDGIEGFAIVFQPWVGWTLLVATLLYSVALLFALPFYQRPQSSLVMGLSAASLLGIFGFLDLFLHYEWPVLVFIVAFGVVCAAIIAASIFLGSKKAFNAIRIRLGAIHKRTPLLMTKRLYTILSLPLLIIASAVASWAIQSIISTDSYGSVAGLLTVCIMFFVLFVYATRQAVFPQERATLREWTQRFLILIAGIFIAMVF